MYPCSSVTHNDLKLFPTTEIHKEAHPIISMLFLTLIFMNFHTPG